MTMLFYFRSLAVFLIVLWGLSFFSFQAKERAPKHGDFVQKCLDKGTKFEYEESYDSALFYYQEACAFYKGTGNEEAYYSLHENLYNAVVYNPNWGMQDKYNFVLSKEAKLKKYPNKQYLLENYMAQSFIFLENGMMDSIDVYYKICTKLAKKIGAKKSYADYNLYFAYVFYLFGKIDQAIKYLDQANYYASEVYEGDVNSLKELYTVQTLLYNAKEDYKKALKSNLASLALVDKLEYVDTLSDLVITYNNLATVYGNLGDNIKCIEYCLKALKTYPQGVEEIQKVGTYNNLVNAYVRVKEFEKAKQANLATLAILNQHRINRDKGKEILRLYIETYQLFAVLYIYKKSWKEAEIYCKKSLAIHRKYNFLEKLGVTYGHLGKVYLETEAYEDGIDYYKKAIHFFEKNAPGQHFSDRAFFYSQIASAHSFRGMHDSAFLYIQKALQIIYPNASLVDIRDNPGLESVSSANNQILLLNQKRDILRSAYDDNYGGIQEEDIYEIAYLSAQQVVKKNSSIATEASKGFQLVRRNTVRIFEDAIESAFLLYKKYNKKKHLMSAFRLVEQSKSMLLQDALKEARAFTFGGIPDSLLEKEERLGKEMLVLEKKQLDATFRKDTVMEKAFKDQHFERKHELAKLKLIFEQRYPKYYRLKYDQRVANIMDVQSLLDEETAFLEYFEGEKYIYIFNVDKKKASIHRIEKSENFTTTVNIYLDILKDLETLTRNPFSAYQIFTKTAHELYVYLLGDILKGQKYKRLVFVPDGILGYLPFESLLLEAPKTIQETMNPPFKSLAYLLKVYKVSYNYSGTLWFSQLSQKENVVNGKILALAPHYPIGDSLFSEKRNVEEKKLRSSLAELPGAKKEIEMLEAVGFKGRFLSGKKAVEGAFKAQAENYGILHLAMHGLVNEQDPRYSSLAFSEDGDAQEDNFLYAYEVRNLNLKAGLVVLSACETGIGKYQRGEGVLSIGRGFMYAGTPSLVMTLWSLNDKSGAVIIQKFYKNLAEGQEKDEAMRQAKLAYLEEIDGLGAYPALWACFVQLGDYSSIQIEQKISLLKKGMYLGCILGILLAGTFIFFRRRKSIL